MAQMETDSDENAALIHDAEARAKLTSWLKRHPGKHKVGEIAEATGYSPDKAGRILREMHENDLVDMEPEGTAKMYSIGKAPEVTGAKDVAVKSRKGKARVTMKELELEVAGFVIVLTKNPANGRPRIVIDQGETE